MEKLKITIEGFGTAHQFELDADIAVGFMTSDQVGITFDPENPTEAIKAAAEYMLRPVYTAGSQAIAAQRMADAKLAILK